MNSCLSPHRDTSANNHFLPKMDVLKARKMIKLKALTRAKL